MKNLESEGVYEPENYPEETDEQVFQSYLSDLNLSPDDLEKKMLDVGSGYAQFAKWAKDHSISEKIFSLDSKGRFIETSKSVIANAKAIPFADNSFELVISNSSMPQVLLNKDATQMQVDVHRVFEELLRVSVQTGEIRLGNVILGGKEDVRVQMTSIVQQELERIKREYDAEVEVIRKGDVHRYEGHTPIEVVAGRYLIIIRKHKK